jgi:hypothetical protein
MWEILWENLVLLENRFLQLIYSLLMLVSGWGLAYSAGLASRFLYRKTIGRALGDLVAKLCKD